MKTCMGIVITIFFSFTTAWTEHCLPNGITFTTQSQIDNFQTDYPGCTIIDGNVTISGSGITNLNGLSVLDSMEADLVIENNAALTSLTGLHSITYVGGDLDIVGNDALTNLTGLDNLKSAAGDLTLENNISLTDLTGLENLVSVGLDLDIIGNTSLARLTGLDNINAIGVLNLHDNNALSYCEVQGICDYLENSGTANIRNNLTGCNSRTEVLDACANGIISLKPDYFGDNYEISILLNSATAKMIIPSKFIEQWDVRIYNSLGQICKKFNVKEKKCELDISELTEGIYFVKINIDELYFIHKIIKE